MSRPQSQVAVHEMQQLQQHVVEAATVSFAEEASLRTAAWAVQRFGGAVLVDSVVTAYKNNPEVDSDGRPIDLEDLPGRAGGNMIFVQEAAHDTALDVAQDLIVATKRVGRGYPLETATVRGVDDTFAVIGSLEKAVEINPDNLNSGEHHFQAAAQYMLDHMVTQTQDNTREYLL